MGEKKNTKGLSESFIAGVIAIVFLIVGFQTALFIHRAAVVRIAAERDEPDTVYVYSADDSKEAGTLQRNGKAAAAESVSRASEIKNTASVRKNSTHSPRAEAVRTNAPRSRIESFEFDPNTVSVEDLCRLGFTLKQAQAIDNYRQKGGRFRRPGDFAKSFVVSDSVYRRLEPYIDIPLTDLNLADSAAFDALPGIGGWFASRIIAHRKALGGYSYKEQLMDIPRFDEEKYRSLEDLVTVSPENSVPYPLWSLPADSLKLHPYINNYETARSIVLYRDNSPKSQWTVEALASASILPPDLAAKLSRCLIALP